MYTEMSVNKRYESSPFYGLTGIEYFDFEEDFVEANVRCIPMIVRFKLDAVGVKLKLMDWSKFNVTERIELALKACNTKAEVSSYRNYLISVIEKYSKERIIEMPIEVNPEWANAETIPQLLVKKAAELNVRIYIDQWQALTNLQRFALLKLCRPGHENKNFPKAIIEFNIV